MYCAWRIPAHLRCTQCSILLHLMDICFLTCICLWQISQIPIFLFRVVGPGLVSTPPAFVSNSASHPAGPHGRHAQKNGKSGPHCWGRGGSTQFAQQFEFAVTAPPLVGCVVWSYYKGHPPSSGKGGKVVLKAGTTFLFQMMYKPDVNLVELFPITVCIRGPIFTLRTYNRRYQHSLGIKRPSCSVQRPFSIQPYVLSSYTSNNADRQYRPLLKPC